MQPDLPSSQQDEKQSESVPQQDGVKSESPSIEMASPEPTPIEEASGLKPSSVVEKKRSKFNVGTALVGLFVLILMAGVAGLGFWSYTLNVKLTGAQQQLTTLQGKHDKLQSDYAALKSANEKLTSDLAKSKADLEKANKDLTDTRIDLNDEKKKNKNLDAQIDQASKLAEVLYAWSTSDEASDIFEINTLIEETNNQQLISEWDKLTTSPSEETFSAFMDYLIAAVRNSLY